MNIKIGCILFVICLMISCSSNKISYKLSDIIESSKVDIFQGNNYVSFTNYDHETTRVYLNDFEYTLIEHPIFLLYANKIITGSMFYTSAEWILDRLRKETIERKGHIPDLGDDQQYFIKNFFGNTCQIFNFYKIDDPEYSPNIEGYEFMVFLDYFPGDPTAFHYLVEISVDPEEKNITKKYSDAKLINFEYLYMNI